MDGMVMLAVVGYLFLKYRPKTEEGIGICMICFVMGLLTPIVPTDTWFLQLISVLTKGVALLCCYLQLDREKRNRVADAERAKRAAQRKERDTVDLEQPLFPAA